MIGKRITFEDVEETTDEKEDEPLTTPSSPSVDEVVDEKEVGSSDDSWMESKYDALDEKDDREEKVEMKESEEPSRRVTRAMTRALGRKVNGQRQFVTLHALKARGGRMTLGETKKREVVWYLVQWKGYGEEDNSWVRASDMHAPDAIREYEEAQQRGDDLGVHYLHVKRGSGVVSGDGEGGKAVIITTVVGDWS